MSSPYPSGESYSKVGVESSSAENAAKPPSGNYTGSVIATIGGAIAVLSFFALPYVTIPLLGSLTGVQVANLLNSLNSLQREVAQSNSSGSGFSYGAVLWFQVVMTLIAAVISGWQWLKSKQSGDTPSRGATVLVLIAGLLCVSISLYPLFGLQTSSLGQAIVSALAIGYWAVVLGLLAVVIGAIMQLRTR